MNASRAGQPENVRAHTHTHVRALSDSLLSYGCQRSGYASGPCLQWTSSPLLTPGKSLLAEILWTAQSVLLPSEEAQKPGCWLSQKPWRTCLAPEILEVATYAYMDLAWCPCPSRS